MVKQKLKKKETAEDKLKAIKKLCKKYIKEVKQDYDDCELDESGQAYRDACIDVLEIINGGSK